MASVSFQNIEKTFGSTKVIHGIGFDISDGEFMVLVGPSGCGKSTLLRMLAGLEEISSGRVLIGDRVVNHVPSRDRDIAMVFQSYALYPHMTVRDNLAFGLKLRHVPKADIERRVNAIAPSFVSTESQRVWLDDAKALSTIESLHILPIPTPEQIAPFVVYLASDESAAVTGTVFPIDAGYMAFKAQVDVMGTMPAGY